MFWNTLILWNFVIFGAEPLLNVLKTTTKGRSLGGVVPYIYIYTENGPIVEASIFRCFSCLRQENSTLNVYVSHTCGTVFFVYSHKVV